MLTKQFGLHLRILAGVMAVILFAAVCGGCGGKVIKGVGGKAIEKLNDGDFDFTAAWLTRRTTMQVVDDSWRIGTIGGKSIKVTTGSTTGVGAWYLGELRERFIMSFSISFANLKTGPAHGEVRFGKDKDSSLLTISADRDNSGKVILSVLQGETSLCSSGKLNVKDTVFTVIMDNSRGDGVIRFYFSGDKGLSYNVEVGPISNIESIKIFSLYAEQSGIIFSDIAVDQMIYKDGDMINYAKQVFQDLMNNFWEGDQESGYFAAESSDMVWEYGMAMLAMETLFNASGDQSIKSYTAAQWKYMQDKFTDDKITKPGVAPNIAHDDAAWTAMTLMSIYRLTNDTKALELAGQTIKNSYEYWKDGSVENGLWYRFGKDGTPKEYNWVKSIYCAGLILSAIEYHELTKGTELADPELYAETQKLYKWIEENLRRDKTKTFGNKTVSVADNLYFTDFYDNKETGERYPVGADNPDSIAEAGSCSSLFGNTAMAVINARLYKFTGDGEYLKKAVETANALATTNYNNNGILLNDRDAWTNAAFMGFFVKDVLPLDGISSDVINLVKNTALSIILNCRTEEGYYTAEWSGGLAWHKGDTKPEQIMTTSTTIHMVCAAALAEKLELFKSK
jgi:hypothetical protein